MIKRLTEFSKKTVELGELEKLLTPFFQTYETFADRILQFEKENVLIMVRSTGRTIRTPSLALKYRINKSALSGDYHQELQHYRAKLHTAINLDGYYRADPSLWENHLPYLLKIDRYLKTHGFPTDLVPAPERSYELVEDEKWIDEKGGKELLEKIGLYARLTIIPVSDPLMFAINPLKLNEKEQYHLIVENKTTYQGLLPVLKETNCATLIYGCGKAVVKSIEQFSMQYPIDAEHHFLYFGDLDREGLSIWYSLNQKQAARPALPFYLACLKKAPAVGKAYQRSRSLATEQFLAYFSEQQAERIRTMLHDGKYYPQEILKTRELQHIWRGTDWKSLICAKS
ncbi:Wadjet anti-phage system protein JetD domain-containing protein [Sporolactobacillus sp. STCC-11]|uniref:Wadjet anti-phage system protein JetD domain-containing protein n=1 Tax=Sporolactobacillus caesalpiniae TaxID=3230362 RepID=UPI00339517F4